MGALGNLAKPKKNRRSKSHKDMGWATLTMKNHQRSKPQVYEGKAFEHDNDNNNNVVTITDR